MPKYVGDVFREHTHRTDKSKTVGNVEKVSLSEEQPSSEYDAYICIVDYDPLTQNCEIN